MMMLACAWPALAQETPTAAPSPPAKYALSYHDQPTEDVLTDLANRFRLVIVKDQRMEGKITLDSDQPVDAATAAVLLNNALWDDGFRIYTQELPGPKTVLHIAKRGQDLEMRTWPKASFPESHAELPADMPGIPADGTVSVRNFQRPVSEILEQYASGFGFVIDPASASIPMRLTLAAPKPLNARQAADFLNAGMLPLGYQLSAVVVDADKGTPRTMLRISAAKEAKPATKAVPFAFEDAPMSIVLAELAKRSGFGIADSTVGVHVTIHEILQVDAAGKCDVGDLVAVLNKNLARQSVIIEAAGRPKADGKSEPVLSAMPIDMARRTALMIPPSLDPALPPSSEWPGVDAKATMMMRYENAPLDKVLHDVAVAYGLGLSLQIQLSQRVTIQVPKPVSADEAIELLNEALLPLGYGALAIPAPSLHATVIRVVSLVETKKIIRTPAAEPSAGTPQLPQ